MAGTVIITGANGSLAIPAVQYLLKNYTEYTAVLTVRNTSESDANTARLRNIVSQIPNAKSSIRPLDLSSLSDVEKFANTLSSEISQGALPRISAIICNAFTWSIENGLKFSVDGCEMSMRVNHISQLSLVMRLLGSIEEKGKIVFLGSDSHVAGKSPLEKFPPGIPENLEELVKPVPDGEGEKIGRGFQRYGNSKLAVIMGMHALNKRLLLDPNLKTVTALALDPGGLPDSRCMHQGVPSLWKYGMKVVSTVQPVLKYVIPALRSSREAAAELIEISIDEKYAGVRGYYEMLKAVPSSAESMDEGKQDKLWAKSLEWGNVGREDTVLTSAFT